MTALVFTYGTLLRGEPNSRLLDGATFIGSARTAPDFAMLHLGGFPAIVPVVDGVSIVGEVFEVDAATLANLDQLEGVPSFYTRETITLTSGAQVFVYVLNSERACLAHPVIKSGDWRKADR